MAFVLMAFILRRDWAVRCWRWIFFFLAVELCDVLPSVSTRWPASRRSWTRPARRAVMRRRRTPSSTAVCTIHFLCMRTWKYMHLLCCISTCVSWDPAVTPWWCTWIHHPPWASCYSVTGLYDYTAEPWPVSRTLPFFRNFYETSIHAVFFLWIPEKSFL